jgi:hypothetical protein
MWFPKLSADAWLTCPAPEHLPRGRYMCIGSLSHGFTGITNFKCPKIQSLQQWQLTSRYESQVSDIYMAIPKSALILDTVCPIQISNAMPLIEYKHNGRVGIVQRVPSQDFLRNSASVSLLLFRASSSMLSMPFSFSAFYTTPWFICQCQVAREECGHDLHVSKFCTWRTAHHSHLTWCCHGDILFSVNHSLVSSQD